MRDERQLLKSATEYDPMLDAALQTYADAAPREGLETRILARATENARNPRPIFGWRIAFAALLLLAGIFLPLALRRGASPPAQPPLLASRPAPPHLIPDRAPELKPAAVKRAPPKPRPHRQVTVSKPFAPIPLSPQERLLAQLATAPQHPLANLNKPAPVAIPPIEISAIQIKPFPQN